MLLEDVITPQLTHIPQPLIFGSVHPTLYTAVIFENCTICNEILSSNKSGHMLQHGMNLVDVILNERSRAQRPHIV